MLTTSASFDRYKSVKSGSIISIIEIDNGTTKIYVSETVVSLTDVDNIYPILKSHSGMFQSFDPLTRKWKVGTVTLKLSNIGYRRKNASSDFETLADVLATDYYSATVKIYLHNTSNITALTDCLMRFKGKIDEFPTFDELGISLRVVDFNRDTGTEIPTAKIVDVYSAAPDETKNLPIPLAWGVYDKAWQDPEDQGLAVMVRTTKLPPHTYVVSDHQLKALTTGLIEVPGIKEPGILFHDGASAPVLSVNDSGRGTVETKESVPGTIIVSVRVKFYVYLDLVDPGNYSFKNDVDVTDVNNIIDQDDSTFAIVKDGEDTGSLMKFDVPLTVSEDIGETSWDDFDNTKSTPGKVAPVSATDTYKFQYQGTFAGDFNVITMNITVHDSDGVITPLFKSIGDHTATNLDGAWQSLGIDLGDFSTPQQTWAWTTGRTDAVDGYHTLVNMSGNATSPTVSANGTDGDASLWQLHQARLLMACDQYAFPEKSFAECEGMKYGSWISSRSSAYSSGDTIKDPAGIVESILRDVLSVPTADIDLVSFIGSEDASVKQAVNISDLINSDDLIRKITEQSRFAFVWANVGQAKLIDLTAAGSTNVTINYSHIIDGKVTVGKTKVLANKLTADHVYQAEYNKYRDQHIESDATSQTDYGLREWRGAWKYIKTAAIANTIAEHYVASSGIWSNPHTVVEFATQGVYLAALELGDWIELGVDVNPHVKNFGATWVGVKMIVTEIRQRHDRTEIKAMELF